MATPLGEPVEPEVYCKYAMVSAATDGGVQSAASSVLTVSVANHSVARPRALPSIHRFISANPAVEHSATRALQSMRMFASRLVCLSRGGRQTGTAIGAP